MQVKNAVLVDGARSAFARGARGKLVATRLDEAGATVLRALLDRNPKVPAAAIEDVGLGNVQGSGTEFSYIGNVQRLAGLPLEACVFHSNRQCGSSMETLHRIAMAIMLGHIECGVAMGIERMGRSIGGGGPSTRITKMTSRTSELTPAQRAPAPDHDRWFSVPFPDYILASPWLQSMPQTASSMMIFWAALAAARRFSALGSW